MLSRRTFLKGMVATAAGILVPREVLAEPERRVWPLDSTMFAAQLPPEMQIGPRWADWIEALEPVETPFVDSILRYDRVHARTAQEVVRVDRLYSDGRVEFVRWEGSTFWRTL